MAPLNWSYPKCPKRKLAFASAPSASSAAVLGTCELSRPLTGLRGWCSEPVLRPPSQTLLTVLTQFSAFVLTLIILVPVRPSRENVISIPKLRRNVCARRNRPASARGFLIPAPPVETSSRALCAYRRIRSDALPIHMFRSAMMVRRQVAMGSASMMLSIAARRFAA